MQPEGISDALFSFRLIYGSKPQMEMFSWPVCPDLNILKDIFAGLTWSPENEQWPVTLVIPEVSSLTTASQSKNPSDINDNLLCWFACLLFDRRLLWRKSFQLAKENIETSIKQTKSVLTFSAQNIWNTY